MASDVLIIGAGPVGLTAALLLARQGLRVTVVERRLEPSTEPRAVSLDDESLRIWQSCGLEHILRDDWAGGEDGGCICTYLDERGRSFLKLYQSVSDLGHPHAVVIHQGRIDEKLLRTAANHTSINFVAGAVVTSVSQSDQCVTVCGTNRDGLPFETTGSWAIGCDGANSRTRRCLGIPVHGVELPTPWLIANLIDEHSSGSVVIKCRPGGSAVTTPLPHGVRRVEVQLITGDTGDWLSDDAEVRRRLCVGWDGASTAPIASRSIRRFNAAAAVRWRDRRIFLAGDAAHVMPPFAGQGLAAGLRDVANLAFKLAGVCQGWLSTEVLDTYEQERRPHLERITRLSCRLGRLMSAPPTLETAFVHAALRLIGRSPALGSRWLLRGPSIRPSIASGFVVASRRAGRYLPQPTVTTPDNRPVLLDSLLGAE